VSLALYEERLEEWRHRVPGYGFGPTRTDAQPNPSAVTMTNYSAEFTVAELCDRAGGEAYSRAGADVVGMDGPHEDDWSLYTTIVLDDGRELETILHHRAGKPLDGDCACTAANAGAFCSHLVWVGLAHLGLTASPLAPYSARRRSSAPLQRIDVE
jgi:hypothetical protein